APPLSTRKGRSPSGLTMFASGGASTTAGVPQKAQADAATPASSVVFAPQREQAIVFRWTPQPRSFGARSPSSIGRSRIASAVVGSFFSAPQNGHLSASAPGFQTTSAPQSAHGNLRTLAASGGVWTAAELNPGQGFGGVGGGGGGG